MNGDMIRSNLKRIRSFRGLSQAKVAEDASISLPAYQKIEGGKSMPRADTLLSIARALDVKIQDLVAPVHRLSDVRFRALKKMTAREQILVDVGAWLKNYNELEELLGKKTTYAFSPLTDEIQSKIDLRSDPVAVAGKIREALDFGQGEVVRDVCGLLESAGIKVFPYPFTNDSFFGLSVGERDGGPAIVVNVNRRMPVERWIFSAVHEFGHLLLHIDSFDADRRDEDDQQEHEANLFASHFLMPDHLFVSEWRDTHGLPFVKRVSKVKRIFKVSYGTVLHRLIEHGWADASIWAKYRWQFRQKSGRSLGGKEEPTPLEPAAFAEGRGASEVAGLAPEDFVPDRLCRLVREALDSEKITLGRAAEMLRLDVEKMRELRTLWITAE